jgi:hypothetical protein
MRSVKLVVAAAIAIFVCAALEAAPAFAGGGHKNPVWVKANGAVLKAGETIGITAKAKTGSTQVLSGGGHVVNCHAVAVLAGAKLEGGEPGTDSETLSYSNCELEGRKTSECEVMNVGGTGGTIVTKALKSKLAFGSAAKATAEESANNGTVTVFEAATGTVFVKLVFTGTNCGTVPSPTTVKGGVVVTNEEGAAEPEIAFTHVLKATGATKYWVNNGGVVEEKTVTRLEAFGVGATYLGEVEVTGGEEFGVLG